MPFKSQAQKKWMYANKPGMAKEWASKTPDMKELPKRVKQHHQTKMTKRKPY